MDKKKICKILEKEETDMLDLIFESREEELSHITEEDKKNLKEIEMQINEKHLAYKNALNNIPDSFIETRRNLINKVNEYTDTVGEQESYFYKKYYKEGLKDGILLMTKCLL